MSLLFIAFADKVNAAVSILGVNAHRRDLTKGYRAKPKNVSTKQWGADLSASCSDPLQDLEFQPDYSIFLVDLQKSRR